jgi:hypothetical protein
MAVPVVLVAEPVARPMLPTRRRLCSRTLRLPRELTASEFERLQELLDACPGLEHMDPELIPPDVAHQVLPIPDPEPPTVCTLLEQGAAVGDRAGERPEDDRHL